MSQPWIAAYAALWAALLVTLLVLLGLMRRVGGVLERAEHILASGSTTIQRGLLAGSVVSSFEVHDEFGQRIRLPDALESRTILLFLEGGCGPCRDLVQDLDRFGGWIDGLRLIVLLKDSEDDRAMQPKGIEAFYDRDGSAWRAFGNVATPQAYVVDPDGRVLNVSIPNELEHLRLLARATNQGGEASEMRSVGGIAA